LAVPGLLDSRPPAWSRDAEGAGAARPCGAADALRAEMIEAVDDSFHHGAGIVRLAVRKDRGTPAATI